MRSKKAMLNVATSLLLQATAIIYGFIIPKIIISKFGSDVNGLVSSITQFLAYISLLESGFGPVVKAALYKPIAQKDNLTITKILKSSEKFFRHIALIFIIYIVILFFAYPKIINESFDTWFTISLIAIIGISAFAEYFFGMTYRLFLQAKQKTYITSIIQIITYIINIAVVVILAFTGANIQILKLSSSLIFALRPILQNLYIKRKYNLKLSDTGANYQIKQKWDGLAQHIAATIHENTDITVLTILTSLSEVSVYSVYYLVITGIRRLVRSFSDGIDSAFGNMIARREKENLRNKFSPYETIYLSIVTIVFTCTMILIAPFVRNYTKNVTDISYYRPVFGYLITISEFIWAIRQPYNLLIKAAGHFKQTRIGAWVECLTNIILSVILVSKLGIVGVAIGTIAAMTIRTIEFIYHANKYILHRTAWESAKKILLIIIETLLIVIACQFIPFVENTSYLNWGFNAFITFAIAIVIVLFLNLLLFRKELGSARSILKSLKRK